MHDTVREVESFARRARRARRSSIAAARSTSHASAPQVERLRHEIAEYHRRYGFGDERLPLVDQPAEAERHLRCRRTSWARSGPRTARPSIRSGWSTRSPEPCSRPAATIRERYRCTEIEPRQAVHVAGRIVRAESSSAPPRATQPVHPDERRSMLPIYSLMIATEPLPARRLGSDRARRTPDVRRRPAHDHLRPAHRRRPFRVRRTRRAVPLRFGAFGPEFDHDDADSRPADARTRRRCFPLIGGAEITHHWGGVLGAPRDWTCGVRFDRRTGLATAGGYVGDGVATTHLAGRTLAALIAGEHRRRRSRTGPAAVGRPPLAAAGNPSRSGGSA